MTNFFNAMAFMFAAFLIFAGFALWLMHQPNSPLKTIALRGTAAAFAVIAPAYVISPVDLMPEAILGPLGIFDDIAVAIGGVLAARYALWGGQDADAPKQI